MYSPFPSDGDDSRGTSSRRFFIVVSGVVGFVLLGVSVHILVLPSTSVDESANLIGMSASRVSAMPTIASLPGPRPWKEFAIAGIEAANTCGGPLSTKSHENLKAAFANMDRRSQALVARVSAEARNKVREMPGIVAPLGFWDPLGFSTDVPQGKLLFYREVELKHGRVCMLAALGILVAEKFHPLFGGNIDVPAYVAFQQTPLQKFWYVIAIAISFFELQSIRTFKDLTDKGPGLGITMQMSNKEDGDLWTMKDDHLPGDLGFDPLGLKPTKPAELLELQNKEILNGRLAMISVAGMIAQELVTKQKIF